MHRWEKLRSESRGDFRIFTIDEDFYRHPEKGERSFFAIRTTDWVNVIAITPNDEIVFIHQFRPGIGGVRLEIPGGVVEPNEDPIKTVARELEEETGYIGDSPEHLVTTEPNPAIQANRCHSYIIRNALPNGNVDMDFDEIIDVELRPTAELAQLIEDDLLPHALLQLPLLRYLRLRESGRA
ncbi:MAG: NUDIX hydrolase [Planctomycetes bacterium]|nr:NUDIX hydrolase [Planctomycetota bacterium]